MELSIKVEKTLKDIIDYDDIEELLEHYDTIISKLNLFDLDKDKLDEYTSLKEQLEDSINRKYLYILIEKIKQNMEEGENLGEYLKDKDTDFLLENLDGILQDYNIKDIIEAKNEESYIRFKYLRELIDKKHFLLLLEHLETM